MALSSTSGPDGDNLQSASFGPRFIAMVETHPLRRLGEGDVPFLWFDGVMLALAALFGFAARRVVRYWGPSRTERRREPVLAAPRMTPAILALNLG